MTTSGNNRQKPAPRRLMGIGISTYGDCARLAVPGPHGWRLGKRHGKNRTHRQSHRPHRNLRRMVRDRRPHSRSAPTNWLPHGRHYRPPRYTSNVHTHRTFGRPQHGRRWPGSLVRPAGHQGKGEEVWQNLLDADDVTSKTASARSKTGRSHHPNHRRRLYRA